MKKVYCIVCAIMLTLVFATTLLAQDDVKVRNANENPVAEESGFKKENLFTGGGLTASFYSGGSVLGINPVLGYKINDYLDAGVVLNYIYSGSRDYWEYNDKYRQHVYGPGIFSRVYPIPFLFLQAQLEENFTNVHYIATPSSQYYTNKSFNTNATSLLLGGGYSSGRGKGGTTFFYVSILADVLKNHNSPYVDVDYYGQSNERIRIVPVIRAGVNVGLFQKRYGYYD